MIYTLSLNSTVDKTIYVDEFKINSLNRTNSTIISAGGKAINVTKTIKLLDSDVISLGFIGGNNAQILTNRLDELNIKYDYVEIKNNIRENIKVIDNKGQLTELNEKGPYVEIEDIDKIKKQIKDILTKDDILVLSGSVCQNVSQDIYKEIIEIANSKVILDADGLLFKNAIEAKPYLIKPNTHELCNYFNIEETTDIDTLIKLCKELLNKGIKEIMLSMSKDGALYFKDDEIYKIEPLDIEVKSSVGAGDAMVGALAVSLQNNYDTITKIKLAIACASGACLTLGTEPADYEVVKELLPKVNYRKL